MAMSKFVLACLLMVGGAAVAAEGTRPEVGKVAAEFELADLQGTKHSLAGTAKTGPVVLMVLGGLGLGLLMGPVLGAAQALALRHAVSHPWRWVGANTAAWPPAMAVIFTSVYCWR